MHQEKNTLDQIPVAADQETFVYSGPGGEIKIEFADGLKTIPEYIVQAVGGIETLKEKSALFKKVKYQDFYDGINNRLRKDAVNEFQKDLVANHFANHLNNY